MRTRTNEVPGTQGFETGIALERSVGFLITAAGKQLTARLGAALAEHGLTNAQWSVLACLWHEDGLTQVELSTRTGIDPATLAEMLKRMTAAGRVTRRRDEHDARAQRVHLADADEAMRDSIAGSARAINAAALDGFTTDEVDQLVDLLQRLLTNLSPHPIAEGDAL